MVLSLNIFHLLEILYLYCIHLVHYMGKASEHGQLHKLLHKPQWQQRQKKHKDLNHYMISKVKEMYHPMHKQQLKMKQNQQRSQLLCMISMLHNIHRCSIFSDQDLLPIQRQQQFFQRLVSLFHKFSYQEEN